MTSAKLDDGRFEQALGAYEGILKSRTGDLNQDAAHRESVTLIEQIFPGFRAAFEAYEDEKRNSVERIKVGNLIRKDGGRPGCWPAARPAA